MRNLFEEKLEMVRKGMQNPLNVIAGNFNYYLDAFGALDKGKKAEAERRYAICKVCPFMSSNAKQVIPEAGISFYPTNRDDEHCGACKCPIEKKVMAFDEKCGLSYLTELRDVNGNEVIGGWQPLWTEYKN